jgi:DNA-binding CsgD family transcriptional regulator
LNKSDTKATNQELILKLSDRQLEVVDFILQGKQVKEISSILNLSIGTIRKHISNIHQILKISKTKQLQELFSSKKFTDSNF